MSKCVALEKIFTFAKDVLFPELLKQQTKEEILTFLKGGESIIEDEKTKIEENFLCYLLKNPHLLTIIKRTDE